MQGIKLNTEKECIDLIQSIDENFRFLFADGTTTYTHYVKHLEEDSYLVIIDKYKIEHLKSLYKEIFDKMPYSFDDIIEVDKTKYFKQLEL